MGIQEHNLDIKIREKMNKKVEIVNDLTTGGVDKALSAEQGSVVRGFLEKHASDIQTLFINWANETKNAATALSQKGVATPEDATMKTIVANISKIPTGGKQIYRGTTSSSSTHLFTDFYGNQTTMNMVSINFDTIGIKGKNVILTDTNFTGAHTFVTIIGSTISANAVSSTNNTWIELGTSSSLTGLWRIPVAKTGSYNYTIYEV